MGIQKDAGEILLFIYEKKISGNEMPNVGELTKTTSWDKIRILNALQYLQGKGLIEGRVMKSIGSTKPQFVGINDLSPLGIDTIENEKEFTKTFNFTINLGVISYSWGASEK